MVKTYRFVHVERPSIDFQRRGSQTDLPREVDVPATNRLVGRMELSGRLPYAKWNAFVEVSFNHELVVRDERVQ